MTNEEDLGTTTINQAGKPPLPPPLLPMTPSLKLRRPLAAPDNSTDEEGEEDEEKEEGATTLSTSTIRTSVQRGEQQDNDETDSKDDETENRIQLQSTPTTTTTNSNTTPSEQLEIKLQPRPNYPPPPLPQQQQQQQGDPDPYRRQRREERRKKREKEEDAERVKQLEEDARRFFIYGFFALPLLWLVSLLYFRKEHKDANASPIIKDYYKKSRLMLIIYTVIFVTWFIFFQIFSDELNTLNIRSISGNSPTSGGF